MRENHWITRAQRQHFLKFGSRLGRPLILEERPGVRVAGVDTRTPLHFQFSHAQSFFMPFARITMIKNQLPVGVVHPVTLRLRFFLELLVKLLSLAGLPGLGESLSQFKKILRMWRHSITLL